MPLLTERAFADPYTQDQVPASAGAVRSASFEQAMSDLPGASLIRSFDLNFVRTRGLQWGADKYNKSEAEYFMEEAGLKGEFALEDRDYNIFELSTLAKRKQAEIQRGYVLARSEGSGSSGAGRFGITLATQLLDPLAIGSAFVPVVSQTRYANLLAKAGTAWARAGVRAGVGAAEGAAGAALVEPLILGAKMQEQADYTFADSFMNIAVGTVFGGGLHVAGGAVADAFRPPKRMTRELEQLEAAHTAAPVMSEAEQAMATRIIAARQELEAAHGDIIRQANEMIAREELQLRETVAKAKSLDDGPAWSKLEDTLTEQRAKADSFARRVASDYEPAAIKAEIDKLSKDVEFVRGLRKKYRQRNVTDRIEARARENVVSRRTVLETKLAEQRAAIEQTQAQVDGHRAKNAAEQRLEFLRTFGKTPEVEKLLEVLPEEARTRMQGRLDAATKEARAVLDSPEAKGLIERHPPASWTVSNADPRVRKAALQGVVAQAVTGEPIEARPFFDTKSLPEAARRVSDPDQKPLSDPKAVQRADEILAQGETADLAVAQKALQETKQRVETMLEEMRAYSGVMRLYRGVALPGKGVQRIKFADGSSPVGIYFTDSIEDATNYAGEGGRVIEADVYLKNPLRTDDPFSYTMISQERLVQLRAEGYDSVIVDNNGIREFIVFDESAIREGPPSDGVEAKIRAEIESAEEAVAESKKLTKAAKQLAACSIRHAA